MDNFRDLLEHDLGLDVSNGETSQSIIVVLESGEKLQITVVEMDES